MKKCPKCGKVLTMDDYETYYDYEQKILVILSSAQNVDTMKEITSKG